MITSLPRIGLAAAALVVLIRCVSPAQDTFSIVAVDTLTGEIGSAGASCVSNINGVGAYIISDVLEGRGAIHTQASWLSQNQVNARAQMQQGKSPQEIIDWLVANDAGGNPTVRQYGVVDLTRRGASAGYTGVNCTNYKAHATGTGWAVQGNILLGQHIIDTIANTYLRTPGPLADRLMAALRAARIVGADTRCAARNTSSQSSFIKVVRIGDGSRPYLQLIVPNTPVGRDPIDSLTVHWLRWRDTTRLRVDPFLSRLRAERDTIPADGASRAQLTVVPRNNADSLLPPGRTIRVRNTGGGTVVGVVDSGNGRYGVSLRAPAVPGTDTVSVTVVGTADSARIAQTVVLRWRSAVGVGEDGAPVPEGRVLLDCYPNPFNAGTVFRVVPVVAGRLRLEIFDPLGRRVAELFDAEVTGEEFSVPWRAEGLPSGVYHARVTTRGMSTVRAVVLLK